jgi:multiple sugar transport system permease protein
MRASLARRESLLAWALCGPVLVAIGCVALFPLAYTFWESLHVHDLRVAGGAARFVGLSNYLEVMGDSRFWGALSNTLWFTVVSVALELVLGLLLALLLNQAFRGRALVRTAALVPWAIPTVVAALVWRFLFEGSASPANALATALGAEAPIPWLAHPQLAWTPIVLADVWKTTPFVALLLLAGLQGIDVALYEAARIDGAGAWKRFWHITLPALRPAIVVALIFRTLDAFRVFDLIYVLTQGGPGLATEPLALYTHASLLRHLRFGYGSTLSVLIFVIVSGLALVYLRAAGRDLLRDPA